MKIRKRSRDQEVVSRRHVRQEKGAQADNTPTEIRRNQKRAAKLRVWAKEHGYRDRSPDEF